MKWNNLLRKKQKGKEKVSIFWKIFAIFVAFIAVILSLLWVFQIGMLNTFYRSIKIHDIENSLKDISDNIDSDKLSTVLKNVANDKQICITLCTQDGSVIYSIDVLPNCIIHELSSYRLARAYELTVQNGGTFIERTMFNERKSQFFLGETDDPNQIESVIYTKIATTKSGENILIFLFFFLIAGGFWLLQTLNNDYEAEFSIPVRVKDLPNNVVLTSEPPSELRVRVKDKGTVLLNYMLGKSFFPVNLSFLDYKGKNNHVKIYASDFEKKILSQLNVSSKILSIKPDTLEYIYSEGKSKLVPVRLQGKVTAGLQYYVSDTICNPDSVLVYAPEGILDTITTAYTQKINLENISDTTRQRISLAPLRGVKFVPSSVEATFPVDIYTEKTVEVPLHGINFPADKALRAFPSKVQITFQVGLKRFRSIKADDFVINVSYEELLKLGSDKYTVKLKSFPNGINQIRIVPEQVDFLIEQVSSFSDVD